MKRNKRKIPLFLGMLALPAISTLSIVSCADPKPEVVKPITEKIKYLAFGDSVTAGYNAELGYDVTGKFENGVIEGISYPAFIAQYIKKINPERLDAFDNYGLSGSTVKDWLYILGDERYKEQASKNLSRFLAQDTKEADPSNIFAGRISQQFGSMDPNKGDFNGFKAKLAEANLVTITLGANDFLALLYNADLSGIISAKDAEKKAAAVNKFKQSLDTEGKKIVGDMIALNNKIRRINPQVKVVYAGYAMPLLRVVPVLDEFLGELEGSKVSSMLLGALNKIVRNGAKLSGYNFVATYDETSWNKRPDLFANIFYDIHPTAKGYKKMAQEILLKISLKGQEDKENPNYNHYFDRTFEDFKKYNSEWSRDYWLIDRFGFNRLLDFGKNEDLVKAILGSEKNEDLFATSPQEASETIAKAIEAYKPNIGKSLSTFLLHNSSLTKLIVNLLGGFLTKLDSSGDLTKILNETDSKSEKTRIYKIVEALLKSEFFVKTISGLQQWIDTADADKNNTKGVQKLTKEILISGLVRQISKKETIKTLIKDLKTLKVSDSEETILQHATPIVAGLFKALNLDPDGAMQKFLTSKDNSGKNNLEKFFTTLTSLESFDELLNRLEKTVKNIEPTKNLGFLDILGIVFGELKNDPPLMHKFLIEFVKSDFVVQNRNEVKAIFSALISGLFSSQMLNNLFSNQSSQTVANVDEIDPKDPELTFVPNPVNDIGKVFKMILKPKQSQKLIVNLISSLIDNPDEIYTKTTNLGELLKKLIEQNKKEIYDWSGAIILSISKNREVREYFYYLATKTILEYLDEGTTSQVKANPSLTLVSHKRIVEIRKFLNFLLDYAIEGSRLIEREDKNFPGAKQKIYTALVENIEGTINGSTESKVLIDKLKEAVLGVFEGTPLFAPEIVSDLKKKLPASEFAKVENEWKKVKALYSELITSVF